jgi:hypothetical protein
MNLHAEDLTNCEAIQMQPSINFGTTSKRRKNKCQTWMNLFTDAMQLPDKKDKVKVLPAWGMKGLGLFVPILTEMHEMRYQYYRDYYFDSSKFIRNFNCKTPDNSTAVIETVVALK